MSRFGRLFPQKTPEEVDRDPVYRQVMREMKPLRDAINREDERMTNILDTTEQTLDKLEKIVAPDNGTVDEVLSAVLECAIAWVPEARIIGNVRAGDISRAVSSALAERTRHQAGTGGQVKVTQPVWTKVPDEPPLELLKSINLDNQVLAYENGRYYNAWFTFEPSEGGWFWTDDADSEPNPSHYMALPPEPGAYPIPAPQPAVAQDAIEAAAIDRLARALKAAHPNHKTMCIFIDDLRAALASTTPPATDERKEGGE